ncbi:uncharacterized protein LOC107269503 isoform X2 [Cephus cinctus]|nr:uncharacterized protein LOC107269503 isoform X2 [Cephus cinctus]
MSRDDNIIESNRKRYCLWMLTFVLAAMGFCNLLLSITIIAVLRVSQGMEAMEVIPDENLIKFYGRTDLDKVCLQAGVCQGYGDEPMELSGDDAGVQINLKNRRDKLISSIKVLANGTTISQVESFEIKDPQTGSSYFSTDFPNFGLPSGVRKIDIDIAVTHRITSPINESLTIKSDGQISMSGGEGNRMEGKEIVWTADKDIFLKSLNGNIILSAKEGISIDIKSIPIVSSSILKRVESGQYKVCVCMPQGKLFRVPVPPGINIHVNCARVSMTPENNPCI